MNEDEPPRLESSLTSIIAHVGLTVMEPVSKPIHLKASIIKTLTLKTYLTIRSLKPFESNHLI